MRPGAVSRPLAPAQRGVAPAASDFVNVQAMRAGAALLVVVGHGLRPNVLPRWVDASIPLFAYSGVDIFFVISGFIVSAAARRSGSATAAGGRLLSASDFACRRVFRIFPLYWCALAVAMVFAGALRIAPPGWPPHPPLLAMVSLTTMWVTPLSVAWTLAFEVYFYAVLTLLILLAGSRVQAAILAWMVIEVFWVNGQRFGLGPLQRGWDVSANPMVLEFGMGWLVSILHGRAPRGLAGYAILLASPFWATGIWLTSIHGLLAPSPRVATFGVGSALLLLALLDLEAIGYRAPTALQRLGDASYSIYLWHMIFFGFAYAEFGIHAWSFGLTVCLLIAWSFVSYAMIEVPTRRLAPRLLLRRQPVPQPR